MFSQVSDEGDLFHLSMQSCQKTKHDSVLASKLSNLTTSGLRGGSLRGGAAGAAATRRKQAQGTSETDLLQSLQKLLAQAIPMKDTAQTSSPKTKPLFRRVQSLLDQARNKPDFDLLDALTQLVQKEVAQRQTPLPNAQLQVPSHRQVVRNQPKQPTQVSDGQWSTVHYWKPKPADWQSPFGVRLLHQVDDLAVAMDEGKCGLLVLLHHQSEVKEAIELIKGEPDCPVTIVWNTTLRGNSDFEDELAESGLYHKWCKIPGASQGKITFKWARLICASKDSPWIRGWIDHDPSVLPTKVGKDSTIVLRVSARKHFTTNWSKCCQRPGQLSRQWAHHVTDAQGDDIMDTWKFQCHDATKVQGLMRVRNSQIARQLIEASGSEACDMRWFIDAAGDQLPGVPRHVAWLQWDQKETWTQYICRARRDAPFGLVHGKFQIGIRVPPDDSRLVRVASKWWMETTPRFWDLDQATALAESLGFTQVDMLSKAQRRKGAAWLFKAPRHDDLEFAQTQIDDYEIQVIKDAKRKPTAHSIRPLANEVRVNFRTASTDVISPPVPSPDEEVESDNDVQDGTGTKRQRTSEHPDATDVDMKNEVWVPACGTIAENAGQGDCLWLSLAEALSHITSKTRSHRQIRAFTVNYMTRFQDDFQAAWDGSGPRGESFTGSFHDYLKQIGKIHTWSGALELGAFAVAQKQKIYVYEDTGRIHVFCDEATSSPIILKFHSWGHFEWLRDACEEEFVTQVKLQAQKGGKDHLSKPDFRGGADCDVQCTLSDFASDHDSISIHEAKGSSSPHGLTQFATPPKKVKIKTRIWGNRSGKKAGYVSTPKSVGSVCSPKSAPAVIDSPAVSDSPNHG